MTVTVGIQNDFIIDFLDIFQLDVDTDHAKKAISRENGNSDGCHQHIQAVYFELIRVNDGFGLCAARQCIVIFIFKVRKGLKANCSVVLMIVIGEEAATLIVSLEVSVICILAVQRVWFEQYRYAYEFKVFKQHLFMQGHYFISIDISGADCGLKHVGIVAADCQCFFHDQIIADRASFQISQGHFNRPAVLAGGV